MTIKLPLNSILHCNKLPLSISRLHIVQVSNLLQICMCLQNNYTYKLQFVSVRGALSQRRNSQVLTDEQIYDEEVDEEEAVLCTTVD